MARQALSHHKNILQNLHYQSLPVMITAVDTFLCLDKSMTVLLSVKFADGNKTEVIQQKGTLGDTLYLGDTFNQSTKST
jgi:hypothetical protein